MLNLRKFGNAVSGINPTFTIYRLKFFQNWAKAVTYHMLAKFHHLGISYAWNFFFALLPEIEQDGGVESIFYCPEKGSIFSPKASLVY